MSVLMENSTEAILPAYHESLEPIRIKGLGP